MPLPENSFTNEARNVPGWDIENIFSNRDNALGHALSGGLWNGKRRKKPDLRPGRERDQTGMVAMLGDAYKNGQGGTDFLNNLINNFRGDWGELERFMEVGAPMINKLEGQYQADQLKGSDAYKFMNDQGNWDMGAMGAYGQQAGQIGQQTRQGVDAAQQGLASQGLGRSSMRSALTSAIQQQGVTNQSNAYSSAQQRASMNRMNSAMSMMDANRMIAQVSMGQQITPRIPGGMGDSGGVSPGAGAAAGALSGASAGAALGPWGALGGALVGGTMGYLGSK